MFCLAVYHRYFGTWTNLFPGNPGRIYSTNLCRWKIACHRPPASLPQALIEGNYAGVELRWTKTHKKDLEWRNFLIMRPQNRDLCRRKSSLFNMEPFYWTILSLEPNFDCWLHVIKKQKEYYKLLTMIVSIEKVILMGPNSVECSAKDYSNDSLCLRCPVPASHHSPLPSTPHTYLAPQIQTVRRRFE